MPRIHLLLIALLCGGALSAQSTLFVPSQFPSIQAAIGAANNGDTIRVSPGVYFENLLIIGKSIVLESVMGPVGTIIDGGQSNAVIRMSFVEDYDARIEGFTLRNGKGLSSSVTNPGPGGILLGQASVTIRNCVIRDCTGGDAIAPAGFPVSGPGDGGAGAISMFGSYPRIEDCVFRDNVGGKGTTSLIQPIITQPAQPSVSQGGAGALYFRAQLFGPVPPPPGFGLEVKRCRIVENTGGDGGGGILGPTDVGGPGAIDFLGADFVMEECLIADNVGGGIVDTFPPTLNAGGCVRVWGGTLDRVTVTGNVDSGHEAVVVLMGDASMRNSIVRANPGAVADVVQLSAATSIGFSNVGGGIAGTGNVDLPSVFVNPAIGDYRLQPSSPLRDLGDGSSVSLPAFDLDGGFRWVGAAPEMGCFEIDDLDGSSEDFQLRTVVNGGGDEDFPTKFVGGGDLVEVSFGTDGGTFATAVPALFVQVFNNGTQPSSPNAFPELEINDQGGTLVLFDGNVFGPAQLGVTPYVFTYMMPVASGITARFQAACFSGAAANGIFATTRAHDLIFP